MKILVIEDSKSSFHMIREMLEETGHDSFEVIQKQNLSSGLNCMSRGGIDVVILDLVLADSQGLDTFCKFHKEAPHVPTIVLTVLDSEKPGVEAVQKGAQDYLVKNRIDSDLLVRSIRYAVERKQMEERLLQSHKMEAAGTLARGIAHSFNNILAAIIGYTEMSIEDIPADSSAGENLKQVLIASNRAKILVKQMLSFSRQDKPKKTLINISRTVKEFLETARATIPTGIKIRQNLSCTSDTVMGDAPQIGYVLFNLCKNAEQAINDTGGVIEVSLTNTEINAAKANQYNGIIPGTYVEFAVSDTGRGIDPENIDRIFDPYFTTKGLTNHTGLGLSVVHGIVKNHGGAVTVDSEHGKGTTFHVLFPVVNKEAWSEVRLNTRPDMVDSSL